MGNMYDVVVKKVHVRYLISRWVRVDWAISKKSRWSRFLAHPVCVCRSIGRC